MIKIDLGKQEGDKSNGRFQFLSNLVSKLPKGGGGSPSDSKGILFLLVACAVATVPYFFAKNFKEGTLAQHEQIIKTNNARLDTIKQELSKFSSFEAEMKSYEEQKTRIVQRIETVNQLLKTRNAPVNVLDAVGQALPQRAWLTGFDFVMTPQPKIFLTGRAFANEDISDFLDRITESIYLNEVSLDSVAPLKSEGVAELKAFEISALPREIGTSQAPRQTTAATPASATQATVAPVPPANGGAK